jgi:nucleoside-triphosphatase THEP1
MRSNSIFVLSGPVHSGKTTRLIHWAQGRQDVFGILTPVLAGKRFFMNAASGETFPMEIAPSNSRVEERNEFIAGKYIFSSRAFDRAIEILYNVTSQQKEGWLIIDEIGPLELNKKGFYDVLIEILSLQNSELKIVLIIRESLVEDVIKLFGIDGYALFKFL